jgi:hypothetical protein
LPRLTLTFKVSTDNISQLDLAAYQCFVGVDSETTKRSLVADEPIPPPKKSVEGEKEAEEKAPKPASEGNEATKKNEASA